MRLISVLLFLLLFPKYALCQEVDSVVTGTEIQNHGTSADSLNGKAVIHLDSLNRADSSENAALRPDKERDPRIHQIRFGFDLARIGFNVLYPSKQGYEFQVDFLFRKQLFLAAEAGFGQGGVQYDYLAYKTNSAFLRLGIDKSLLEPIRPDDFDQFFIGARYGLALGQRNEARYLIDSPFGTRNEGRVAAQAFTAHWFEILGGVKVELWKGIFAGWTARGRFLINPGVFHELAPNYIAGYGKGDRKSVFDFHFYLSYALRWQGR